MRKRKIEALGGISVARNPVTEPTENTIELDISMKHAKESGFKPVTVRVNGEEVHFSPWLCSMMALGPVPHTMARWRNGKGVPLWVFLTFSRDYQNDNEWGMERHWAWQNLEWISTDPLPIRPPAIRYEKFPSKFDTYGQLLLPKMLSRKFEVLFITACLLQSPEFIRIVAFHKANPAVSLKILCEEGPTKAPFRKQFANDSLPVDPATWSSAINNPKVKFGHGFVVAAVLAGLTPSDYALLTPMEQVQYREIITGRIYEWSHPPGIETLSKDPEFILWLEESKKIDTYVDPLRLGQ